MPGQRGSGALPGLSGDEEVGLMESVIGYELKPIPEVSGLHALESIQDKRPLVRIV
jgi:hypothetical protein